MADLRPRRPHLVPQHRSNLPLLNPRKPLNELVDRGACGKVLVERDERNPRAGEDASSAHPAQCLLAVRALAAVSSWYGLLRHAIFDQP